MGRGRAAGARPVHGARRAAGGNADRSRSTGGAVEVSGGRVLVRIATEAGTVTSEVIDPPHPPGNKPLVTVSVGPDGKPLVKVEGGKAGIRILDS